MAMMNTGSWNGQDQNMSATGDDDFQQFFDIGMSHMGDTMQFDFQGFNAPNPASMMQQGHRDEVDTPMSDANAASIAAHSNMGVQSRVPPMTSAPAHSVVSPQIHPPQHTPSDAISKIDAQIQFLQHQRLQQQERQLEEQRRRLQEEQAAFYAQQQHQRNLVPPTPQSLEMQATSQFYTSRDRNQSTGSLFEGYQQIKDQQDMAFTPLVSPAVTPLDAHFSVDHQYMVPGAYFSPITSPALHAQPDSMLFYDPMQSGRTSHTTNSPAAMDTESPPAPTGSDNMLKEARKTNTAKRKPKVRQSPITRPQRKKMASTPVMNAQALNELVEVVAESSSAVPQTTSASVSSNEASENASVSPEALEMPPPPLPLPRSARQSPYIAPQNSDEYMPTLIAKGLDGKPSPATPASLFRISPGNQAADLGNVEHDAPEHIESFQLPEAVNSINHSEAQPALSSGPLVCASSDVETPKMTPLQPLPSPITVNTSQPVSTTQSPQLTPRTSTPASKKTPVIAPKGGRKRASVSSVSPALLPKISPNIKPLLPGAAGLSNEDSASILLASKSNYQRILEGNTMPGVTYPSELSKTLTSKRTSHKIAEQGRRNRINSALVEIAALLPKGSIKEGGNDDGDVVGGDDKADGKQSNTPNSKASTVESAIEYIKHLQKQLVEANKRADEAEKKLWETTTKSEDLAISPRRPDT